MCVKGDGGKKGGREGGGGVGGRVEDGGYKSEGGRELWIIDSHWFPWR